jgi:hypothetical protein
MAFLSLLVVGALYFLANWAGPDILNAYRAQKTAAALAQAREALIGFAVTYRDAHPGEVFGQLPCPDTDNDGVAELNCGLKDVTVVGRLPWKTLGLSDLRDGANECLWYVVSGHFKYNPKTDFLNWDTTSRIALVSADGQASAPTPGEHGAPIAVIVAPGGPVTGQSRTPVGATVCGGNNTPGAYLEGMAIAAAAETEGVPATNTTVTVSTAASTANGTNNDTGVAIYSRDIFDQVQKRSDFKNDIDTRLLASISGCLNGTGLPVAAGSKGIEGALAVCGAAPGTLSGAIQASWKQNLLYSRPGGTITVNGDPTCTGVLAFSGSRTAVQTRRNAAERDILGMYLTAANSAAFPDGVSGGASFDPLQADQDLFVCLSPSGPITVSFDNDIARFTSPEDGGLSINLTSNPDHPSVEIVPSGATSGGCIWYPNAIPLAGRVWRVFYRSQFLLADPIGGSDAGYGYTFQLVTTTPGTAPNTCGLTTDMGALGSSSPWGSTSVTFETDIHRDSPSHNDPIGNHFAIMYNGSLEHSATNGDATAACDGSRAGCILNPRDTFEESPAPLLHAQRIEIHTGCDSTCSTCNASGLYVRLRAWADCSPSACSDLTVDMPAIPSVQTCIEAVGPDFGEAYFGFTGGFNQIGGVPQGVTLWDFNLRAE